MKLNNCKQDVEVILNKVKKPITYTGNEVNSVHKKPDENMIRFALAFPDIYEVGMSHLGLKILYGLLNQQDDIWAERTFAPWKDMEELMVENGIPLFTLESTEPVRNYDFLGFSLQYEMSYTNLVNMLALGHIPLESRDRTLDDPFVIAGGPGAMNPEPLADFIDLFIIGEAEEVLLELMDVYREWKKNPTSREDFLKMAAGLEGIYVPSFYTVDYNGNGTIKSFRPNTSYAKPVVKKRFVEDLDEIYYPKDYVVSYTQTVHDRLSYEIMRGCPHGCRFCQAGQIYRPVRFKDQKRIKKDLKKLIANTGYEEISLASLSSGDHPKIESLITDLVETYEPVKIGVTLPSLRIDALSIDMLGEMKKVHKGGITLAPEAGTQRLRDVINKNVKEEDLIETVSHAFEEGWGRIKLYFMVGLPTETDEDVLGIKSVAEHVVDAFYDTDKKLRNKNVQVVVSTSCFVPKPFTPFQWTGQLTTDEFKRRQNLLKESIKNRKIKYNWHDPSLSFLEAVFARGDRRLGKVLKRAWELGCRFDSWSDSFEPELWKQAFEESGVNPDFYALRQRDFDEILPWDFIDIGISKDFLRLEYEKALIENTSVNCKLGCENCGMLREVKSKKNLCYDKSPYTI